MASRHFVHYAIMCNNAEKNTPLYLKKGAMRSYLLIENRSNAAIYVNFEMGASVNDGVLIPSGGVWELDNVAPDNTIFIAGSTLADQRVNITEAY